MNLSKNRIHAQHSHSEVLFRDQLINQMLIMWTILALIGFTLTQLRAMEIGWTVRDLLYFIVLSGSFLTVLYRRKLSTQHKAIIILLFYLLVAVVGTFTFGMLAGSIFFLPLSAVIIALFYTARTVAFLGILFIAFLCFIAEGFVSKNLEINPNADFLLTNYAHWSIYILSFAFFFLITCVTIINYRQSMGKLITNINYKQDKLEKANNDLQRALNEIRTLRGILPLCSFCKKIRDDQGYWEQVDVYIHKHSEADISHGICPECMKEHYPEEYAEIQKDKSV